MTTIQDRIELVKNISKVMAYEYSEYDAMSNNPTPEDEAIKLLDNFIKLVEEETRKEIIKNINTHKTLVAVADGNKYFEVMSIGNIIVKPIKNVNRGASYKQVIYDEAISITYETK